MRVRKVAQIDVDNTLADTETSILAYANSLDGKHYELEEVRELYRGGNGTAYDKIVGDFLHNHTLVEAIAMNEGVRVGLRKLKKLGYEVHVASARQENLHLVTPAWLLSHGVLRYVDEVHNRPNNKSPQQFKLDTARSIGAILGFDDDPKTATLLAEAGVTMYLIDKPWNRAQLPRENIIRAESFARAVELVK